MHILLVILAALEAFCAFQGEKTFHWLLLIF